MKILFNKRIVKWLLISLFFCLVSILFTNNVFAKTAEDVKFITTIRTVSNPYQANVAEGSRLFAASLGLEDNFILQQCERDSAKQLRDIRAAIARYGSDIVYYVDPNNAPDAVPIAKLLDDAGIYFVLWWNKSDDVAPWDYDHWVTYISPDDVNGGYMTGKVLCEAIGGKGNIIAIEGLLGNSSNDNRIEGLMKALEEFPDVKLLPAPPADGYRTKAYEITLDLVLKYGDDLHGIWTYNDDQAMGIVEALRAKNLVGKIPVVGTDAIPEMIQAIMDGEATATISSDPYWSGGISLSLALAAYEGKVDVKSLPLEKRCYYCNTILITQENIGWYNENYIEGIPEYDWNDYWGRYVRPLPVEGRPLN